MRTLISALALAWISACAYPSTLVSQGAGPSAIYFIGAPENAEVLVDGLSRGSVAHLDGHAGVLAVAPGRHHVELRANGSTVLQRDVFVGSAAQVKIEM